MKRFVIKNGIMGMIMIIILSFGNCVLAKEFDGIKLTYENLEMNQGETALMLYTITPAGADNIENKTWLSHDSEIVEIDEKGKITAKKEGTTDIELVINGKKENGEDYSVTAKCEITVKQSQNHTSILEEKVTKKEAKEVDGTKVTTIYAEETKVEKIGISTKAKLIAIVTILGLIVIFILIGVASDKKQRKVGQAEKTKEEKTKEEKEKGEEKNDKKE